MLGVAARASIIGSEQARIAELLVHQPEIEGAGEYVVARIVGIVPEAEPCPHVRPGSRHQLHEPHRAGRRADRRSEEHTSELQSLMRISYDVFCLKKKKQNKQQQA